MFRTRTWVPGRAVPWVPWVPGACPRGSLGAQTTRTNHLHRPFGFASKFMKILMLIFDRFGVDLGPLWRIIFDHVGALFGPSLPRNRLRAALSSKKSLFTKPFKTNGFTCLFAKDDAPRRPKTAPTLIQDRLGSFFVIFDFRFDF